MLKEKEIKIDAKMQREFEDIGASKFEKYQTLIVGTTAVL